MLSKSNNQGGNLLILKPVQKKNKVKVDPHFELSKIVDDKWTSQPDEIDTVTGKVVKIVAQEKTFEQKKYWQINLYLTHEDNRYWIPFSLNMATRSLVNSLLSLKTFDNVSIKYTRNKKGFDTFYVDQGGEEVRWKFEQSEIPEVKVVSIGGNEQKDFYEVDKFFLDQVVVLNDLISKDNLEHSNIVDEEASKELGASVEVADPESTDNQPF